MAIDEDEQITSKDGKDGNMTTQFYHFMAGEI